MMATEPVKPKRGRPPQISRDDIIDAVLRGGAEPTLVAIAHKLKVTPQALYHHIDGHSDLIHLLFGAVVDAVDLPDREGRDWVDYSIANGFYIKGLYDAVPGLAEYAISSQWSQRILFERRERVMEAAVEGGFSPLAALWAYKAIADFVQSWVAREYRREVNVAHGSPTEIESFRKAVPDADQTMPLTVEAYRLQGDSTEDRFEFTLRALVQGLATQMKMFVQAPRPTAKPAG